MVLTLDEKRYGRLLAKTLPAIIGTEEENEHTLGQIEVLMDKGEKRSPEESRLLDLLVRLVSDFEATNYDLGETTPEKALAYLIEQRGLKQADLLPVLGCSKGALSDMLSGRRGITTAAARKLADFFRVSVDLFV